MTSLTGFKLQFSWRQSCVITTLIQRWYNVVSTLCKAVQRCFYVGHWRCINVVQCWKSDVGFCFIFNVSSTLFQRWSTTLKQRWSDVEILTGIKEYMSMSKEKFLSNRNQCIDLFCKSIDWLLYNRDLRYERFKTLFTHIHRESVLTCCKA